jgi:DNA gyrase/topoisomerase IV subunit A
MIRKGDVQWWVLEAKKHPESVPEMIEELAGRLVELDAENERLRAEMIKLERREPVSEGSVEVEDLRRKIDTLQSLLDGGASAEPSLVFLSNRMQSARMPLSQVLRLAREARPALSREAVPRLGELLLARPQDELLLLTSQGRGFRVPLLDVPPLEEGGIWSERDDLLASEEHLTAAVAVAKPPRFWTIVTRKGFVRQQIRIGFDQAILQGERLIESPLRNDPPVALVSGDGGDLLLITRWGRGVRFPQKAIAAEGSIALELEPDDAVAAALPLSSDAGILIVTAAGFAARRETARIESRTSPGGRGKPLIQAYDVLSGYQLISQDTLLLVTYSGKLHYIPASDVPLYHKSNRGTRLRDLGRDPAVAAALIPNSS